MISRTPLTIVLVYSPGCSYCRTYMPIWKELCKTKKRQANLVSMEAATYDRTPMAKSKSVKGVPSVLFVDSMGRITEATNIRDTSAMTNVVRSANTENMTEPKEKVTNMDLNMATEATEGKDTMTMGSMSMGPMMINTMAPRKDSLHPLPGYVVPSQRGGSQRGGNPWAAFLATAAQAAPAAALLGAYSMLPERSSGLPRPQPRSRRAGRRTHKK